MKTIKLNGGMTDKQHDLAVRLGFSGMFATPESEDWAKEQLDQGVAELKRAKGKTGLVQATVYFLTGAQCMVNYYAKKAATSGKVKVPFSVTDLEPEHRKAVKLRDQATKVMEGTAAVSKAQAVESMLLRDWKAAIKGM